MRLKQACCLFVLGLFCFSAAGAFGESWENLAGRRSKFFRATVADIPDSREWINRRPWLSLAIPVTTLPIRD